MQRWRGIDATPTDWGRSVVTIGVFDGVHRGHQRIIGQAVESARRAGLASVVVTFDPHPAAVVRPDARPSTLTDLDRRAELIAELGVDGLCVQPFTKEFSQLSPESFVNDLLVGRLHVAQVVVGENFRFGHKAAGDVHLLEKLGQANGFTADPVALAGSDTTVYSSTYVRSRLAEGDVEAAAQALGRPHRVSGTVVRGADRGGSQLGFPTANLSHDPHAAVPADGVYAGWFSVRGGEQLPAAISVGTNPTFVGSARTVEAHVLDFSGDLYGEWGNIDFVAHLREQRTYDALPPLIAQMEADVATTRKVLAV
ncbi:riboflavin kinase/FMN adenylyltransferase [Stackebrandtia endophytica]|uniref:Riboflavin biosynthesis protein n=1 Tax=Stackebrandtia endophytica TaxID=1496996 RepID=A0A543ASG8_9ACTN|nr:bifunctional riboflavin kinase/FAD synthetase [Stackebrandtia endophytica]TQL75531.1 riboflavin kinase/FMN adenylyltransferase [Stackebrandtia endophytica]